jgi:hypothetical protein
MGVVGKTLEENYLFFIRELARIDAELAGLPKGSLSIKKIAGGTYFYRQWREGKKVRTETLGREAPAPMLEALRRRKQLQTQRAEILENLEIISRAVDTQRLTVNEIVRLLEANGVKALLAGSYCLPVLKERFGFDLPSIRTEDADFVVQTPYRGRAVDIETLLGPLGFIPHFHADGSMYFSNGSFKVEFLTPEKGRGADGSIDIKPLKVRAQPLRYVNMLATGAVTVSPESQNVTLPNPWVLAFHKLLVSRERKNEEQRKKDLLQAKALLREIKKNPGLFEKAQAYLETLPPSWRKTIKIVIQGVAPDWPT